MSAGLALPRYEGPRGELVVVEQADDHHHHHCHHHDDDDDLNKLQFSCTETHTGEESRGESVTGASNHWSGDENLLDMLQTNIKSCATP